MTESARVRHPATGSSRFAWFFCLVMSSGAPSCFEEPGYALECEPSTTRTCFGRCGEGIEHCVDGYFEPCMALEGDGTVFCDAMPSECQDGQTRTCGSALGMCTEGIQVCESGLWGGCSGREPTEELCDGRDNNCNGQVDEGFGLGFSCALAGGCPGRLACAENETTTNCVVDESRLGPEVCDGSDNDCDGLIDYTLTESGLRSACHCEIDGARFATKSPDSSGPQCEETVCSVSGSGLTMTFCLDCSDPNNLPFAMCENTIPLDLSRFDGRGSGAVFLAVDFEYSSTTPVLSPINLWYKQGERKRKYLNLLGAGDQTGSHSRVFAAGDACLPEETDWGTSCVGSVSGSDCDGCAPSDTCGNLTGCDGVDFTSATIQLAAEWCPWGVTTFSGELRLESLMLVPPECLSGRD